MSSIARLSHEFYEQTGRVDPSGGAVATVNFYTLEYLSALVPEYVRRDGSFQYMKINRMNGYWYGFYGQVNGTSTSTTHKVQARNLKELLLKLAIKLAQAGDLPKEAA